jgi:hypothetical protein
MIEREPDLRFQGLGAARLSKAGVVNPPYLDLPIFGSKTARRQTVARDRRELAVPADGKLAEPASLLGQYVYQSYSRLIRWNGCRSEFCRPRRPKPKRRRGPAVWRSASIGCERRLWRGRPLPETVAQPIGNVGNSRELWHLGMG